MRLDRRLGCSWTTTGGRSLTLGADGAGCLERVSSLSSSAASKTTTARLIQRNVAWGLVEET